MVVTLAACTLAASVAGYGQALPTDPVERAKVVAQFFEANARRLMLFDREGKEAGVVGQRDVYNQPVFSPDRTPVAVCRIDLDKERSDLWVLDIATGRGTQITASQTREQDRKSTRLNSSHVSISYAVFCLKKKKKKKTHNTKAV